MTTLSYKRRRELAYASYKDVSVFVRSIYSSATGCNLPENKGLWPLGLMHEFTMIQNIYNNRADGTKIGEMAVEYLKLRLQIVEQRMRESSADNPNRPIASVPSSPSASAYIHDELQRQRN